jgi:hypothetical protein
MTSSQRLRAAQGPVVTAVLSVLAAAQALQLWSWRPGLPISATGDAPYVLLQVRAIMDASWFSTVDRVGAPYGLNQSWLSTADVVNFLGIKVLGLLGGSPATTAAIFFLLGFPAAALSAYWLGRQLHLARPAAVTTGVLFSVLPGHQLWFDHLWLASYWMVPLAVWLVVQVARGEPLWPPRADLRAGAPGRRHARWLLARTVAIVLAVGLADVYYVAFTLLLLAIVMVFRLGTGTRAARLAPGAVAAAGIGLLCGLSLVVATRGRAGDQVTSALPAQRVIGESETYAGKIIELVLPWSEHRVPALQFLSFAYGVAAPASVERPALGVVALVGVVAILWLALTSLALGRRIPALWGLLAALTLVSLAFYTRGGLGSLVALFVTPQIRTWSRFVLLIGLFGLLAVGLWLTRIGRRRGRRAAWVAAGIVLAIGVLDQTSPGAAPHYAALKAQQRDLTAFTQAIAGSVGPDCSVFQLPVVAYPEEPPPGRMADYDHLLPSNASPAGLHWSYGAIRGTARGDWQLALPIGDQKRLLEDIAAAGFCAVEIDSDGYAGASDPSAATESLLGPPVARAERDHLAAYSLRSLAPQTQDGPRSAQVLRPVIASLGGSLVDTTDPTPFQWTGPESTLTVSNMGVGPVEVTLTMEITGNGDDDRTVTIAVPGQKAQVVTTSESRTHQVSVQVAVPPGSLEIWLRATGDIATTPGSEGKSFAALKVSDLRLTSTSATNVASLQQFAAASPAATR